MRELNAGVQSKADTPHENSPRNVPALTLRQRPPARRCQGSPKAPGPPPAQATAARRHRGVCTAATAAPTAKVPPPLDQPQRRRLPAEAAAWLAGATPPRPPSSPSSPLAPPSQRQSSARAPGGCAGRWARRAPLGRPARHNRRSRIPARHRPPGLGARQQPLPLPPLPRHYARVVCSRCRSSRCPGPTCMEGCPGPT